jgi:hypothetical protein
MWDVAAIQRRLPAPWRVAAAMAILAAGAVVASEVHRKHGVPIFLAAIGCGAVLRSWALGIWVTLVSAVIIEQAATGRFDHFSNGDNVGAEWGSTVVLIGVIGAVGIVLGIAFAAAVRLIASRRSRP